MSFVKDIYQDLIDKKTWLVAVGLVAVLVAFPMYLSKPGTSTVAAQAPPAPTTGDASPELNLTRASTTGFAKAPRVNKKEIDPFGNSEKSYKYYLKAVNAYLASTQSGSSAGDTSTSGTVTSGGDTSGSTGVTPTDNNTGGSGTTNTPSTTTPASTTPAMEKDTVISVVVTPKDDSQAKEIDDIRTLSPLPDSDNPFLVYVGKTGDDEAQFIVASNAAASGDGTCSPNANDCSTLTLAVGQTEKFVVTTTDNTVTPAVTTTENISITLTDIATKKVPVDDGTSDDTAVAARYQAKARAIGARVVKAALIDPKIARVLYKNHVTIGA